MHAFIMKQTDNWAAQLQPASFQPAHELVPKTRIDADEIQSFAQPTVPKDFAPFVERPWAFFHTKRQGHA